MPEGIWTGGMMQEDEKQRVAEDIAGQQVSAVAGETKRKGRSKLFGNIGGFLAGEAGQWLLTAALTAATGGLAGPALTAAIAAGKVGKYAKIASTLQKGGKYAKIAKALIKGGAMTASRGAVDWATKSKHKRLKTSGQVEEITADSKYGYGEKEAQTLTEALTTSRESGKQDWGTLLANVGGSYAYDIMGDKTGSLFGGKKEFIDPNVPFQETELGGFGVDPNAEEGFLSKLSKGLPSYDSDADEVVWSPYRKADEPFDLEGYLSADPKPYAQGGQVPSQEDALMELLALVQPQQEEKQQPSIADYFASQGKTLGGNNTQPLSKILGV